MSKFNKILVALVLASMILAACATPTPAPTEAPTPAPVATEAPTAVPPTQGPTATAAPTVDCKGAQSGDTLSVVYQWSGNEEQLFNTVIKPFVDACGVKINAQSTRDGAVLDTMVKSTPPDVLFWPDFSPLKLYADKLQPLDSVGVNTSNYPSYWAAMGTVNGKLLALPFKVDVKSIIWYSPAQFQALGYTVPTTFADLQTLVDKMATDKNIPWSMGFESGSATGWTGSDFIQDILLATQGPDYVNGIISGKVPYNDPAVLAAYQIYQKWASDPAYTVGGAKGTVSTNFNDAINLPFDNPPKAMMVKQSGFAGANIAKQFPNLKYGTDYDFFEFPGVKGLQGGADFMFAFSNKPAAQALLAYLSSVDGGKALAASSWGLTPVNGASSSYTDPQLSKLGGILANAGGFTFDIGDALGAPFNASEWKAIVNVVQGQDIKTNLDAAAADQQKSLKGQ